MDTVTSTTLLEAIKQTGDHAAWARFHERYGPMIASFAVRLGLSANEAEDIAQETLMAFFHDYRQGKFDHDRGRLRSWLFSITRCNVIDAQRRKRKEFIVADQADADGVFQIEFPNRLEDVWDEEWHRSVVQACLAEIAKEASPQTIEIFTLYVLKEWPPEKVAQHLGVTIGTVYLAKNRVMKKFSPLLATMKETW